jgi:hypothetical protein
MDYLLSLISTIGEWYCSLMSTLGESPVANSGSTKVWVIEPNLFHV